MFSRPGSGRTPLAGTWKYRVERQTNAGALYTKPGQLAAHVAFTLKEARPARRARRFRPSRRRRLTSWCA